MQSGVNMLCFAASYSIALALELSGLWIRTSARRVAMLVAMAGGVVAHVWYLGRRVAEFPEAPLASPQDWYGVAALALATVYVVAALYYPRSPLGLLVLPTVLALVVASWLASAHPVASSEAPRFWSRLHGICLMLGTVTVVVGFLAGIVYLWQSHQLKRKRAPSRRFPLPSLEWLDQVNNWALGLAALFVGGGFLSGVLGRLANQNGQKLVPWTDPVVLTLGLMLLWLLGAEVFRLVYPAARQGRKVAYLTVAAFVFLLLVLFSFNLHDTLHDPAVNPAVDQSEVSPSEMALVIGGPS